MKTTPEDPKTAPSMDNITKEYLTEVCRKSNADMRKTALFGEMVNIFIEKGVSLEHDRWAKWQKYLHSKCFEVKGIGGEPTGALEIPVESVRHWERQITTPYLELSEKEKESDRVEVRKYSELLLSSLEKVFEEGKKEGLKFNDKKGQAFREGYETGHKEAKVELESALPASHDNWVDFGEIKNAFKEGWNACLEEIKNKLK